ncbi:hypothetical protein ACT453_35695, partial [Bacillus sp. D-CC]
MFLALRELKQSKLRYGLIGLIMELIILKPMFTLTTYSQLKAMSDP